MYILQPFCPEFPDKNKVEEHQQGPQSARVLVHRGARDPVPWRDCSPVQDTWDRKMSTQKCSPRNSFCWTGNFSNNWMINTKSEAGLGDWAQRAFFRLPYLLPKGNPVQWESKYLKSPTPAAVEKQSTRKRENHNTRMSPVGAGQASVSLLSALARHCCTSS